MKSSTISKVAGWASFAALLLQGFLTQQAQTPAHGWAQWLTAVAGLAAAVGIHASSSTDGTK